MLSSLRSRIQLRTTRKNFGTLMPFNLADIGEGIAEVELMKWFVKEGDIVKSFDRICEVQSDKATVEITSRYNGKIFKVYHKEGDIVKVGKPLVEIEVQEAATSIPLLSSKAKEQPIETHSKGNDDVIVKHSHSYDFKNDKIMTTPAVRKLARENNIDLSTLNGSGPKGRILKEDLMRLTSKPFTYDKPTIKTPEFTPDVKVSSLTDTKVAIRGIQRLMVKSMEAANNVKHLTLGEEIVLDALVQIRKQLKPHAEKVGIRLSYLPFIIKATSLALLKYPRLNATVNADCTETIYHHRHNIGIAMDSPKGLLVPVLNDVQSKSIFEIAADLVRLQDLVSTGKITENYLQGGTFTLSNIGSIGGTYAVPVLVVPQVCIGAIGRIQIVPRYMLRTVSSTSASLEDIESGEATVKPVSIVNVSWSADHRVIDGAVVAAFSNELKMFLESPYMMISYLK